MKILFVYYLPSGGVETLNRQRSQALQKHGVHVDFLYYQTKRSLINDHYSTVFITNDDQELKSLLLQGNYDAIIVTSDYNGLARFRSFGFEGLLIFEIQGLGPIDTAKSEMEVAFPLIVKSADGILLSSTPHLVAILNQYPSHPPRFVFHNCIHTNDFNYQPQMTSKQPILAWIGRFEPNKNWKEFITIGDRLIKDYNPNIQLYLFEDHTLSIPSEKFRFEHLIKELNLESNVKVLSNIPHDQMPLYFSKIGNSGGLLLSTSITEGFGYAIVEAMTCRCPVVSTRSDGVVHSIVHQHTGMYYDIGNITEAFIACQTLMENNKLREYIRGNAVEHVKSLFGIDQYALNFIAMINHLHKIK